MGQGRGAKEHFAQGGDGGGTFVGVHGEGLEDDPFDPWRNGGVELL